MEKIEKEFKYHYVKYKVKSKKINYKEFYDHAWKKGLREGISDHGDLELSKLFFEKINIQDKDSSILEIGCGIGSFLSLIYDMGYHNIIGIDISEYAINFGNRYNPQMDLRYMDARSLNFPDNLFDVCISFDLVEHLTDIDYHFIKVLKILSKNGKYIFQTPNKISNVPISVLRDRTLSGWKVYHPSLQYSWGLKKRLLNAGFKKVKFFKISPLSKYKIQQFPKFLRWIFKIIPWNILPFFLQTNFYVIAYK